MYTKICNELLISNPTQEVIEWVENNLIIDNPDYKQLKALGKEDTIKYKRIPEKLKIYSKSYGYDDYDRELVWTYHIPYGCYPALWKYIKKYKYDLNFNKCFPISIANDKCAIDLFDYQEDAVSDMLKAKSGVLISPCGSGKTYMGIELIKRIGLRTLWLCHTGDLLRQARDDMKALYPNIQIGITTDGELNIGADVTIATIQTMVNIYPGLYKDEFDVVICDECAHVVSAPTKMKMFGKILSNVSARYKYGLTATPSRSDGMINAMYMYLGMSKDGCFEGVHKVPREKIKTMICEHKKYELNSGYDDSLMFDLYDASGMLDYNKLINCLSFNSDRNKAIIDNIVKCKEGGRKQVVLTKLVEHAENLVSELENKGVKAVLCVGKISAKKREKILKQEIEWDVIVATYSLLKEGVSIKELDTLHMTVPIKDKAMVVQCAGRIERYLDGKKTPIVYDYVDTDIPYCEKAFVQRRRALKSRY